MSSFTTLKANARINLDDAGVIGWDTTALDYSMQDAYDDIVARTQCITKKVTLSWVANQIYYDFTAAPYSVTDFMAITAIFNNVNNRWLDDNVAYYELDRLRNDWELWVGTPEFWIPLAPKYNIIVPHYTSVPGTFDLYYYGSAPTIVNADTPLIATDMQSLLELYVTADLLEQNEEFNTAITWWKQYFAGIEQYAARVKNIAKSDLLLLG